MHELTHALGFTSTFMQSMSVLLKIENAVYIIMCIGFFRFYNQQGNIYNPVKQFNFNGKKIPGITSPKVWYMCNVHIIFT